MKVLVIFAALATLATASLLGGKTISLQDDGTLIVNDIGKGVIISKPMAMVQNIPENTLMAANDLQLQQTTPDMTLLRGQLPWWTMIKKTPMVNMMLHKTPNMFSMNGMIGMQNIPWWKWQTTPMGINNINNIPMMDKQIKYIAHEHITPMMRLQDVTPMMRWQDGTPLVHSQDMTPMMHSQDMTPMMHLQDMAPMMRLQDMTPMMRWQDGTPLVNSQDMTPIMRLQDMTPMMSSQDMTPMMRLQDMTPMMRLQGMTPIIRSQDMTPMMHLQDMTPIIRSQDMTPMIHSQDLMHLQDMTPVMRLEDMTSDDMFHSGRLMGINSNWPINSIGKNNNDFTKKNDFWKMYRNNINTLKAHRLMENDLSL